VARDGLGVCVQADYSGEGLYYYEHIFFCDGDAGVFGYDFMLKSWARTASYAKSIVSFGRFGEVAGALEFDISHFDALDDEAKRAIAANLGK